MLSRFHVDDGYFDIPTLYEFCNLLEYQGWMPLFKDVKNAFMDAVREFYVNLKQLPDYIFGIYYFLE